MMTTFPDQTRPDHGYDYDDYNADYDDDYDDGYDDDDYYGDYGTRHCSISLVGFAYSPFFCADIGVKSE